MAEELSSKEIYILYLDAFEKWQDLPCWAFIRYRRYEKETMTIWKRYLASLDEEQNV